MQFGDFERMVDRMLAEIPAEYLEGIAGIEVSPRTVSHPERDDVFTMGECIPIDVGSVDRAPSRVVLYHGSFRELSRQRRDFDWRGEAWETLTHELRHHLEWKANQQDLEEYDWAADQGFARGSRDTFDPAFYLAGERLPNDGYQVDDDVFFDRLVRRVPERTELTWEGRRYELAIPPGTLPLYLAVEGLNPAPAGDVILAFRRKPGLLDLFRSRTPPREASAAASPILSSSPTEP